VETRVEQILGKFRINVNQKLNSAGTEFIGKCPFHVMGKSDHTLSINADTGLWRCFSCDARGNLPQFVKKYTENYGLSASQIDAGIAGQMLAEFKVVMPKADRSRYLSEIEIDVLTHYCNGLYGIMQGKRQGIDSGQWLEYLYSRGFTNETIEYFKLGANAMKGYGAYFIREFAKVDSKVSETLRSLMLVNGKVDYWYKPSVIIPYWSSGQCLYANARVLPKHEDGMRYIGMAGVSRNMFFHDDALDQDYESLFVVEGEFNAMAMWQAGYKNVVSFGGKQSLSDVLISSLYGYDVTLYFDTDKSDLEFKARGEAMDKLLNVCKSVSYFELPEGIDINDYIRDHGSQEFEDKILSQIFTVNDSDDFLPSEYRIIPEAERDKTITLAEMQAINAKSFRDIADNFKKYTGKRILNNSAVGTGKTTGAIALVNSRKEKTLILTSTHYEADVYDSVGLDFDCFSIHLKGRSHVDIGCIYADKSELYSRNGYALKFKLEYCQDCIKRIDGDCLYLDMMESANTAGVLIGVHAYGQLKDFFNNPYYGNKRRNLIIIDEQCDLIKDIYFDKKAMEYNKNLLDRVGTPVASELSEILSVMEFSRLARQSYKAKKREFEKCDIYEIEKDICRSVNVDNMKPCKLYDFVYALEDGIEFKYNHDLDSLYYTWRAKLPSKACVIFMSATLPKAYLEQVLGVKVDEVIGEQYDIRRDNLQVIQMLNVVGGRGRLIKDEKLQENIKDFFKAVLGKYEDKKIMIITSQGSGISEAESKGNVKQRIIEMLNPIAKLAHRRLVGISTLDIQEGAVPDSFYDIPVIHYGIRGTNIFGDYDVLVELNAHFYNSNAIAEGVKIIFDVDVTEQKPEKKMLTFRTQDKEYEIERYIHPDAKVRTYIEATQEGDIMQAEGRILRGEDTPKVIYRLHNVNIKPYPTKVYKGWQSLMASEFGIVKEQAISGKLKAVLDWIQTYRVVNQTFSTKEVVNALGGYSNHMNNRYLKQLQEIGIITQLVSGIGKAGGAIWERKL
jgi:hypothetical protein